MDKNTTSDGIHRSGNTVKLHTTCGIHREFNNIKTMHMFKKLHCKKCESCKNVKNTDMLIIPQTYTTLENKLTDKKCKSQNTDVNERIIKNSKFLSKMDITNKYANFSENIVPNNHLD